MGEPPIPHMHPPPPLRPPFLQKSNLPMLYYGIFVLGTAATVLVVYNLIIVKLCTEYYGGTGTRLGRTGDLESTSTPRFYKQKKAVLSSFKYKKNEADDSGCAVCLSEFEEGEEIRQLPRCKHCFHAPCIDMWLYSHFNCPLCRSLVEPPVLRGTDQSENSREGLPDPGNLV